MDHKRNPTLTIATFNIGDHGRTTDAFDLFRERGAGAVTMQEGGDQDKLLDKLEAAGYATFAGYGELGQGATPIAWDPAVLRPRRNGTFCLPMVDKGDPRLRGHAGAGPTQLKPKWVVGHTFTHLATGRIVRVGSTHVVPSVYIDKRRAMADQHVRRAAGSMHGRGLSFLCGDFNMTPGHALLRPMGKEGWVNNHEVDQPIATHGNRAIDYVWWRRDERIAFVGHRAVNTGSDHHALLATFAITPRRVRLGR